VVGAAANNGYGTLGVASGATLAGFYTRFGAGGSSRDEIADLLTHQVNVDVSNNSWGYADAFADNFQKAGWTQIADALRLGVTEGRNGLGTNFVFAAGNDRQYSAGSATLDGDNTNYHNLTNSRFSITVAASTQDGHIAPFSTPGASILVTAPGDSILTTTPDNGDGDRSNDFIFVNGTSFAAPIVSGIVAMMLEANPDLGYRDVQDILAISAHQIDPASASWSANGAATWNGGGHMVSHDFGFGLVDAYAAVRLAEIWNGVHNAANEASLDVAGTTSVATGFSPDGYAATVSADYRNFAIQWVEVDLSLTHTRLGDLKIHLISPDGTDSILLDHPAGGTENTSELSFTFSTNHAWGESPVGTWRLYVEDSGTAGGSLEAWTLHIYGDQQTADTTYYYTNDFAALAGDRSTLSDASGDDTINAAAVTGAVLIDLTPGATSMIGGRSMVISADTVIENVHGGDGNDTISGNAAGNTLHGGRGDDTLSGGAGDDELHGGLGRDTLYGGAGHDQFWIDRPGGGADLLGDFTGDGMGDVAWYNPATGAIDLWQLNDGRWAGSIDVGAHPAGWRPVASDDFNGDGATDIAWYNAATGNIDIWMLANGRWSASVDVGSHPAGWQPIGAGDFNGDGASDIAWFDPVTNNLDIWMLADGRWSASVDVGAHPAGWTPAVGDFNGDGTSDILWVNAGSNAVEVWELDNGHWAASVDLGERPAGSSIGAIGDFDQNGASDIM
jgi:subtilisin-like proprotein convertase family protein